MPESIRPEKNFLTFNQGLNTESSEIAFPDGFSTDERNYELLLDGSRRRRKGLAQESGGSDKTTTNACNGANQTYVWTNVGGDPDKTFIVHKFGSELYFTDDAETISTSYHGSIIELDECQVTTSSTSMDAAYATFSSVRGYLIVTGPHIQPTMIEYVSASDLFEVTCMDIAIRDYIGIEDGVAVSQEPTSLSADHKYNLVNAGWPVDKITTYNSDLSKFPAKNSIWYRAFRRAVDASYADEDGTKAWHSAKLDAENFGDSFAPRGALIIRPSDSTFASDKGGAVVDFTTWSYVDSGSTWRITLTTSAAHGFVATDVVTISNLKTKIVYGDVSEPLWQLIDWSGSYTCQTGTTGSTLVIDVAEPDRFLSFQTQYYQLGSVGEGATLANSSGTAIDVGPAVCEVHDGRIFYAAIPDSKWADYVFFSQVPDARYKLDRCYQEADPSDPERNQLVDTDGGYFVIQGIQNVKQMLSVRNVLLVFAENGVWEVGGGQRGFFTPSGYSIRKITEVGCNSPLSPVAVQNTAMYTGSEGIFRIAPNQYTGILEATSISKDLIQTKWNAIAETEQRRTMSVYDDSKQRVLFLYGKNAASGFYDEILIIDLEIPAWYYYQYNQGTNTGILSAYAISYTTSTEQANKIKFSCNVTDTTTVRTCDHGQTTYIDFDGSESPLPYVVTGWDSIGDIQRRRQAPIITVYAKRTETGYTDTGTGWSGDNESSNLMTAYWDWTDDAITNKIGDQQQTYRHVRAFIPSGAADVNGYPVVVTRNKVRGRGRVLQLRFDGEATKDTHIMGFTVNYRAQNKI